MRNDSKIKKDKNMTPIDIISIAVMGFSLGVVTWEVTQGKWLRESAELAHKGWQSALDLWLKEIKRRNPQPSPLQIKDIV